MFAIVARGIVDEGFEDVPDFVLVQGQALGAVFRPNAVAERVKGPDGGGWFHSAGCFVSDGSVEADEQGREGALSRVDHLQHCSLTCTCSSTYHYIIICPLHLVENRGLLGGWCGLRGFVHWQVPWIQELFLVGGRLGIPR